MLVHRRVTPLPPPPPPHPHPAVCRRYPFIHLGEERRSGVKFLVWGNNATGEAWTPHASILEYDCTKQVGILISISVILGSGRCELLCVNYSLHFFLDKARSMYEYVLVWAPTRLSLQPWVRLGIAPGCGVPRGHTDLMYYLNTTMKKQASVQFFYSLTAKNYKACLNALGSPVSA